MYWLHTDTTQSDFTPADATRNAEASEMLPLDSGGLSYSLVAA